MKIDGHLTKLEKDYNEFKLQYNKQNVEDILIQRPVKTTIQILYDKGLFDKFQNADKVLEHFFYNKEKRWSIRRKYIITFITHGYKQLYGYFYILI